jgi:hypothetical protein
MHESCGMSLQVLADGIVGFAKQSRAICGFDLGDVTREGQGSPIEEIAPAVGPVKRDLVSPENQTGEGVSGIADARKIAPGTSGIARMNPDAVAMDAARRFARRFFARRPSYIAQDELVGRE